MLDNKVLRVRCINNKDLENYITIGNEYITKKINQYGYELEKYDGETIFSGWISINRFEIVKEENKVKEYSLQEVYNEEEGTEFKVKYEKGNYNKSTVKVAEKEKEFLINRTKLVWNNGEDIQMKEEFVTAKFIKVQLSVSFNDVINSSKRCRVEHKNVNIILENKNITFDKDMIAENFRAMQKDEYIDFDKVMLVLSRYLGSRLLKQVITEGKWYLERENDN